MAAKLTKTQQRLLEQAKRHGGDYSIETGSGRGAKGGRISYGDRERAALFALEAAGLVRITWRQGSNWFTGNGNSVYGTVFAYEIVQ
jgi:hypothetical protein